MTQPMMLWRVAYQSQEMEAMAPAQFPSRSKVCQSVLKAHKCIVIYCLNQTNNLCMEKISTNKMILDNNGKA